MKALLFIILSFFQTPAHSCNPKNVYALLTELGSPAIERVRIKVTDREEIYDLLGRDYVERLASFGEDPLAFEQLANHIVAHRGEWNTPLYDKKDKKLPSWAIKMARRNLDERSQAMFRRLGLSPLPRDTLFFLKAAVEQGTNRLISKGDAFRERPVIARAIQKEYMSMLHRYLRSALEPGQGRETNIEQSRIASLKVQGAEILAKGHDLYRFLRVPFVQGGGHFRAGLPVADLVYRLNGQVVIEENKRMAGSQNPGALFEKAVSQLDSSLYFYRMKYEADPDVLSIHPNALPKTSTLSPYSIRNGLLFKNDEQVFIKGLPVTVD